MAGRDETNRDPLSRAALRQLLFLGAVCSVGFVGLVALLGWFSSLTATGAAALPVAQPHTERDPQAGSGPETFHEPAGCIKTAE